MRNWRALERLEQLEDRLVLSGLAAAIPDQIDPLLAEQAIFAPTSQIGTIAADVAGSASRLYKFAVDGVNSVNPVRFDLAPATNGSGVDAALALFDENGNVLFKVDADTNAAERSVETLAARVSSATTYVLGVYFNPAGPPIGLTLAVSTAPQTTNTPVALDAATGQAHLDADAGEDTFNTSADVDFYPIHFTNATSSATVTVTPTGLDVEAFATLYRRGAAGAWMPVASGSGPGGGAVTLHAVSPPGESLHDGEYLLGVAPLGYNTPARSYAIDVQAAGQLVPHDVGGEPIVHDFRTPLLSAFGEASHSYAGLIASGSGNLFAVRAPLNTTGTMSLTLESNALTPFQPAIGVYEATGMTLVVAASRLVDGRVATSFPTTAGERFLVRVGDVGNDQGGAYALTVAAALDPQVVIAEPLASGASVTTVADVPLGTDVGAAVYRIVPAAGADVLAVSVETNGGSGVKVAVVGENVGLSVLEIPAGDTLLLPVDLVGKPGAIDVFVQGTTSPQDTATLSIGMIDIPSRLYLDDFETAKLDEDGRYLATFGGGPFGSRAAVMHYQVTSDSDLTGITADALQSGAAPAGRPLLVRYRQHGATQMDVLGYALPSAPMPATINAELSQDDVHGFLAISLDFAPIDTISIGVDGPEPLYVGVGMVPDPALPLPPSPQPPEYLPPPPQPELAGPYFSVLKIRDILFEHDFEQHLWSTLLPHNILDNTTAQVTLSAQADGPQAPSFATTVTVMDSSGGIIASQTNLTAGPTLTISLPNASQYAGDKLLFKVEPLPNQMLGDGLYSLQMKVETENPYPFLVTETAWRFHGTAPAILPQDMGDVQTLPEVETVKDIIQDQFGDGSYESELTSSLPFDHTFPFLGAPGGNAGSIDVFRFWVQTPGPVTVRSVPLAPMNGDPPVNTNLKVYQPRFDPDGSVRYLGQVPDVTLNMDWFPADRSEIDAQTYVNDFDVLAFDNGVALGREDYPYTRTSTTTTTLSGGLYYVVVKNEQGSTGPYRIEVDAPSFPLLSGMGNPSPTSFTSAKNGQTTYIPQDTFAAVTLNFPYVESISEFVGYFPIQFPDYHDGTFKVTPQFLAIYDVDLFTAAGGEPLAKTITTEGSIFQRDITHFTVPLGPQTMYLRIKEILPDFNVNNLANLELKAEGSLPTGFAAPPASLPATTPTMLPTDPFGDGDAVGTFAIGQPQQRAFTFKAAAGPLTVNVVPQNTSALAVRWGVYADGQRIAWDQTSISAPNPDQTTTTTFLPRLRGPLDTPDYEYDLAPYQDVTVWVQAVSGQGDFTISVDAASELPMRTRRLAIDPLGSIASNVATGTVTGVRGNDWIRLDVPDDASPVDLTVTITEPGIILGGPAQIRLDVYDADGNLVTSRTEATSAGNPYQRTFAALAGVAAGDSYYVRASAMADARWQLSATASTTLAKLTRTIVGIPRYGLPPAQRGLFDVKMSQPTLTPEDGEGAAAFGALWDPSQANLVFATGFWVNQPGVAAFSAKIDAADPVVDKPYVALYKGNWNPVGENPYNPTNYELLLVDYTNGANAVATQGGHLYDLQARLEPGFYVLLAESNMQSAGGNVTINLADYNAPYIVLDPNFGTSVLPPLFNVTDETSRDAFGNYVTPFQSPILPSFRHSFYEVVAPPGSQAAMMAVAVNRPVGASGQLPLDGEARVHVWRQNAAGVYELNGSQVTNEVDPPAMPLATTSSDGDAKPGQTLWIDLRRKALDTKIAVAAEFIVPASGDPDLAVETPILSPNNGQTRVDVTVRNVGFAPAPFFDRRFQFTDTLKNPDHTTTSDKLELPIGPLGSRSFVFDWIPVTPDDFVEYFADYDPAYPLDGPGNIPEPDETNNHGIQYLYVVDESRPTVSMSLLDGDMDGMAAAGVWGRYISGVSGATTDIEITGYDTQNDLYRVIGRHPFLNGIPSLDGQFYSSSLSGNEDDSRINFVDFGQLSYSSPQNLNQFKMRVQDKFGLLSDELIVTAQVEQFPGWLDNEDSELTFDKATHSYQIKFRNALVDWGPTTLDDLTGEDIPFVGGLKNRVLAEIKAEGTASLDPAASVDVPVTAQALVRILGKTVFDETFTGQQSSGNFQLQSNLQVNKKTLAADWLGVTFRLVDYPLYHWESPEITLFAYGVPEVASIDAYMQFLVDALLNAGVTIAINPSLINNPLQVPEIVGLTAPTFVAPSIIPGIEIGGSVEFVGVDIASLSGTIQFAFTPALGFPTSAQGQLIPFADFWNTACLGANGTLTGEIAAEVLGIEVFSFDLPSGSINFNPGCTVAMSPSASPSASPAPQPANGPVSSLSGTSMFYGGDVPVGRLASKPAPNLIINPASDNAMYVQLVDVDPTAAVRNELVYSRREGGAWTPLSTIPTPSDSHVSNVVLARTEDDERMPTVAVYQAVATAGNVEDLTRNAFFAGQDIRWRYFDGTSWGGEQSLTSNTNYETDHAVAFNADGRGVVAWVENTNPSPLADSSADTPGELDRTSNEIRAAVWNRSTQSWGPVAKLTTDTVADGRPAVFADERGTLYVLWLRDTANGNEIVYSKNSGGGWSSAQALPINGFVGGKFGGLAIGSEASGRINVQFSHTSVAGDESVTSRLYNRPSTVARFALSTAVETVVDGPNFAHLRSINAPDGALVAYWQQSDGVVFDVFAARLDPVTHTWSRPFRISGGEMESSPSLAIDKGGRYQLVYDERPFTSATPNTGPMAGSPPAVGMPTAGSVGSTQTAPLPELGFSRGISFPGAMASAAGLTRMADAQAINRGPAGDDVLIEYLVGDPALSNVVASETVFLGPGGRYDLRHPFEILAGNTQYSARLMALGSGEVIGDGDNVTTTSLAGLADITIDPVDLSNASPVAGETVDVKVRVRNNSSVPINMPFAIYYTQGDPDFTFDPSSIVPIGTQTINSLGPFETVTVSFNWIVPGAGVFPITVVADSGNAVDEANEANNRSQAVVVVRPDAAAVDVAATELNYSGVDNVSVTATIANFGDAPLVNLAVRFQSSYDDLFVEDDDPLVAFVDFDTVVIPLLAPGQTVQVASLASGLAGLNAYRVLVDPDIEQIDADWSNNVAETSLILQGLADLDIEVIGVDPDDGSAPPMPTQGEPFTVRTRISNDGILAARDFKVEVFALTPQFRNVLVGSAVVEEVGPLSTFDLGIPVDTSRLLGQTNLTIIVDRLDKVLESSEYNNQTALKIIVKQAGPDDAVVLTRKPFYRGSSFVTQHPSGDANHDTAIATDKVALRSGEASSPSNVVSYTAGINGILVDIAGAADGPTLADFLFRVGNSSNVSTWLPAPTPDYFVVRPNAGDEESTRIEIGWPDGAIAQQWLEVTILANDVTNLPADDVFYFGHALGDTGNLSDDFRVDGADVQLVEQNTAARAAIDNPYDFNRDGRVDEVDEAIARDAQNAPFADLDRDDQVGLSDLGRIQTAQDRTVPADYYDGDLTGDGESNRADVVMLSRHFGQVATAAMLANRLQPIAPGSRNAAPAMAASALAVEAAEDTRSRRSRNAATDELAGDIIAIANLQRPNDRNRMRIVTEGVSTDDGPSSDTLIAQCRRRMATRRFRASAANDARPSAVDSVLALWDNR